MEFIYSSDDVPDEDPPIAYDDYRCTPFTDYSAVGRLWKEHFQRSHRARNPEVTRAFHMRCDLYQFMYPELTRAEIVVKFMKEVCKIQEEVKEENALQVAGKAKALKMKNINESLKWYFKKVIKDKDNKKSTMDEFSALNEKTFKKKDVNKTKNNNRPTQSTVKYDGNKKSKDQIIKKAQIKNQNAENCSKSIKYNKISCEVKNITKAHIKRIEIENSPKPIKYHKINCEDKTFTKSPTKNIKSENCSKSFKYNKISCEGKNITKAHIKTMKTENSPKPIKYHKINCEDKTFTKSPIKDMKVENNSNSTKCHTVSCENRNITKAHIENTKIEIILQSLKYEQNKCQDRIIDSTKQRHNPNITSTATKQNNNYTDNSTTKAVKIVPVKTESNNLKTTNHSGKYNPKRYKLLVVEKNKAPLSKPLKSITKKAKKSSVNMVAVDNKQYKTKKELILKTIKRLEAENEKAYYELAYLC